MPYICVYRKEKLLSGYPPVPGRDRCFRSRDRAISAGRCT